MIDIVLCTDENYVRYYSVVVASALSNADKPSSYRFHVVTSGLTEETSTSIVSLAENMGAKLYIYNVDLDFFSTVKADLGRFGLSTLLRLYMGNSLPWDCNRVLYLDGDLIVLDDLTNLWNTDLQGHIIGAVPDLCSPKVFESRSTPYFNAGVLLIDLKKWRSNKIAEKALDFLSKGDAQYLDQDALNHVFSGRWCPLDVKFNMQPAAYTAYEKKYDYISRNQIRDAVQFPNIVHFIGPVKPWHSVCRHPLQQLFLEFSALTPWPISKKTLLSQLSWGQRIKLMLKHRKIMKRRHLTRYKCH